MHIETERLIITDFTEDMAEAVHLNSLDEDNRRFVPDEVFETLEDARETVQFLMSRYGGTEGPFVHPILLKTGENIGYVQLVPIPEGWELGYHIAKKYTSSGYATEAVRAFLPAAAEKWGLDEIWGICLAANGASARVMEKCGFTPMFRGVGPYQGARREIVRNVWNAGSPARSPIERTEAFLKQKFDASPWLNAHPDKKAYRLEHTYRVANIGREIARKEGFDEVELVVACLLHDIAYYEEFGENGWLEHGRRSAQIARPFLRELGMAEDRIEDICYGIAIHVDDEADFPGERTPFALSVGDADNIDRFDAYRILETLQHDGFLEKSLAEKTEYVGKRIARLREMLDMPLGTGTARDLWKARLNFYIAYYDRLADQLARSQSILE